MIQSAFHNSADGKGELYAYLPITDSNTRRLLAIPGSHQNPDYGFSVGRGSFFLKADAWTTVAERVKLNDLGQENGEPSVGYTLHVTLNMIFGIAFITLMAEKKKQEKSNSGLMASL